MRPLNGTRLLRSSQACIAASSRHCGALAEGRDARAGPPPLAHQSWASLPCHPQHVGDGPHQLRPGAQPSSALVASSLVRCGSWHGATPPFSLTCPGRILVGGGGVRWARGLGPGWGAVTRLGQALAFALLKYRLSALLCSDGVYEYSLIVLASCSRRVRSTAGAAGSTQLLSPLSDGEAKGLRFMDDELVRLPVEVVVSSR